MYSKHSDIHGLLFDDGWSWRIQNDSWCLINHNTALTTDTHKFEWLWSTTGGLMFIFFPSPSIGSYDAWWFTARHEWQPQLMSSTLASGFFLTFIWMQLDMYYPWNPLRSSCYLSIHIYIYNIWYVYDIFSRQKSIEKLVIELINLSFSTYPFIYWRRACCLNHSF